MATPSLTDLEAFAAVARLHSFRRAALERGVSPSLLSQTVRRLEEQVGVVLLNRTTRSVLASDAGEELLRQLAPALLQIHDAVDRINRHRESPVGALRINAPAPVAQFLLAPLAAAFLKEYPGVSLEICADAAKTDIVKAGFDAGVRVEGDLAQDVVAVQIGPPQPYCVVAAEAYFKDRNCPGHPDALLEHECIRRIFPGGTVFDWVFKRKGVTRRVQPKGSLTVNDAQIAVNAATAGAGIAYVHESYVKRELASGELVQVLQEWSPGLGPPFLYYPKHRYLPASLRAFIDFAKTHDARRVLRPR